jgi:hypothetical protein
MIELTKLILENVTKHLSPESPASATKDIVTWRDKKRVADIGASMFKLYMAAEEIVEMDSTLFRASNLWSESIESKFS